MTASKPKYKHILNDIGSLMENYILQHGRSEIWVKPVDFVEFYNFPSDYMYGFRRVFENPNYYQDQVDIVSVMSYKEHGKLRYKYLIRIRNPEPAPEAETA
jgi:hypothetical protein